MNDFLWTNETSWSSTAAAWLWNQRMNEWFNDLFNEWMKPLDNWQQQFDFQKKLMNDLKNDWSNERFLEWMNEWMWPLDQWQQQRDSENNKSMI